MCFLQNLSQNSTIVALTNRIEQLEEKLNEATSRLKVVNQEVCLIYCTYASCVRTACPKLSTSLERAVNIVTTLLILSDLLQGCSNKSDTVVI